MIFAPDWPLPRPIAESQRDTFRMPEATTHNARAARTLLSRESRRMRPAAPSSPGSRLLRASDVQRSVCRCRAPLAEAENHALRLFSAVSKESPRPVSCMVCSSSATRPFTRMISEFASPPSPKNRPAARSTSPKLSVNTQSISQSGAEGAPSAITASTSAISIFSCPSAYMPSLVSSPRVVRRSDPNRLARYRLRFAANGQAPFTCRALDEFERRPAVRRDSTPPRKLPRTVRTTGAMPRLFSHFRLRR